MALQQQSQVHHYVIQVYRDIIDIDKGRKLAFEIVVWNKKHNFKLDMTQDLPHNYVCSSICV